MPCLSRKAPLFYGGSRFLVEQIHKGLLLGAQAAPVRVDQHIPHLLALGRHFFSTRWYCSSALRGMGDAHM